MEEQFLAVRIHPDMQRCTSSYDIWDVESEFAWWCEDFTHFEWFDFV